MDDRAFGFQYLDRIRTEMGEIHKTLVLYSIQGVLQKSCGAVKSLQNRYHALQDQEVDLVLASKDKVSATELLIRIRILIGEIEKVMLKARPFQQLQLPRCLSSCYVRGTGSTDVAAILQERYQALTQHEFRIALADVQAAVSQSATASSLVDIAFTSGEHSVSSTSVDKSDDLPPAYK
ncbi:hypothetical protein BG003_011508 [Podila horticola]|nr:hypothetical protein BG003_011508 [Podila horticola]